MLSLLHTDGNFRYALTTVNCIPWLSQHLFRKALIGKTQLNLFSVAEEGNKKKDKEKKKRVRLERPRHDCHSTTCCCSSEICLCEKHTQRHAGSSVKFFWRCERRESCQGHQKMYSQTARTFKLICAELNSDADEALFMEAWVR